MILFDLNISPPVESILIRTILRDPGGQFASAWLLQANGTEQAMTTHGLLYTEDDIASFVANRRFLAAVHAYSMDRFPLGEAVHRAAEGRPLVPRSIQLGGYIQLIQEVAERIVGGKITVPEGLRQDYPDIYDATQLSEREFYGAETLKFSELRKPDVKKKALQLYRRTFDEEDIQEFIKDRRILAGIDAYGKGILNFRRLKEILFGDLHATPRDLSFDAFLQLCLEVVPRIQAGTIELSPSLEEDFPEIYHPPPPEPQ